MTINPSLDRRWLQTAGLPPEPAHAAVRRELDLVTRVRVGENSSRILLMVDDEVIGALDLVPAVKERIDQVAFAPADADKLTFEHGLKAARPGDTIIREFDPNDPTHKAALEGPRIIYDPAAEPLPIDLPDYEPPEHQRAKATGLRAWFGRFLDRVARINFD